MAFAAQITPYVVRIIEVPTRETTVADILLGSLGLTGVIVLSAIAFGFLLGGLLVWIRNLRPENTFNGQSARQASLRLNTLEHP